MVDRAFDTLHKFMGNTTLLKMSDGGGLEFLRVEMLGNDAAADNNQQGTIRMADGSFFESKDDAWTRQVVYHEIGHNFDDESSIWHEFLAISSWTPAFPIELASFGVLHNDRRIVVLQGRRRRFRPRLWHGGSL